MDNFVNLHRHSDHSTPDGAGTSFQFAERAAELGQAYLGQTDHGSINGALKHLKACEEQGIIPIQGIESYWRPDRRVRGKEWQYRRWHLILLAISLKGWHNLIKISSAAFSEESFYQNPCVDWELLEEYQEGLVCTSACALGPVPYLLENGTDKSVDDFMGRALKIFGDRFYLEIMPHDWDRQRDLNLAQVSLANKWGCGYYATVDAHYVLPDWYSTQKILTLIGTNTTVAEAEAKNRERLERGDEIYELGHEGLHLMGGEEVRERFMKFHPNLGPQVVDRAIATTLDVARMVKPYMMNRALKMPRMPAGIDPEKELIYWCREGMKKIGRDGDEIYEAQLEYELSIIRARNNFSYMWIVGDLVRWAKSDAALPPTVEDPDPPNKKPIRLGAGRGSAAGSLVCYTAGITGVDPIAHKLKFERFMNPGRKGIPDIDLDFESVKIEGYNRRPECKEYLVRKHGRGAVADVVSYSTYQPRAALKDVSRILGGVDYQRTEAVVKMIDPVHDQDLEEMRARMPALDSWATDFPEAWKHAVRIENKGNAFVSRMSKHAGGVVILSGDVVDYIAIVRAAEDEPGYRTAWSETPQISICDDYGILKIDVLGLTGIARQSMALDSIYELTGKRIDLDLLPALADPYDVDPKVMKVFQDGHTLGINQFGGDNITTFLRQLHPENLIDLAAANALFRPGPIGGGAPWTYAKRKNGEEKWEVPDVFKDLLGETYGVMPFQESVMGIFQVVLGYTAGQADDVRKEIDKLNRAHSQEGRRRLAGRKDEFVAEATRMFDKEIADRLWADIVPFTGYCLSGDTVVIRGAAGPHSPMEITLRDLAVAWVSKTPVGKKLRRVGVTLLAMDSDGRVRPARASRVWSNGIQPVYEITTVSGLSIRATRNHRFLTQRGYVQCDSLLGGDSLVIMSEEFQPIREGVKTDRARGKTYVGREGGLGVPSGQTNPAWLDGRTQMFELAKEDVRERANGYCEECGRKTLDTKHGLEFAHTSSLEQCGGDYSRYHSSLNIRHLCNSCHKIFDYSKGERKKRWTRGRPTALDSIASVKYIGTEEVFDVEMSSSEHNFIANGVVSHNSFNRAHATGYAIQAYQDAWLKTYYAPHFYSPLLTTEKDLALSCTREARYFDVSVLPPDVNVSKNGFTVDFESNALRYGLSGISGIGDAASVQILEDRPFTSMDDFEERSSRKYSKVNKKARDRLLRVGALDCFGARADWTAVDRAKAELELLGVTLEPGGLLGEDAEIVWKNVYTTQEVEDLEKGADVIVGGNISEIKTTTVKRGRQQGEEMAFVNLSLDLEAWRLTLFPDAWASMRGVINSCHIDDKMIMVKGRKDDRGGIIAQNVIEMQTFILDTRAKQQEMM